MLASMLTVVTRHSSVVPGEDRMIDVRQIVANDFPRPVHPRFDPDLAVSTPGGDNVDFIGHFFQPRSRPDRGADAFPQQVPIRADLRQ